MKGLNMVKGLFFNQKNSRNITGSEYIPVYAIKMKKKLFYSLDRTYLGKGYVTPLLSATYQWRTKGILGNSTENIQVSQNGQGTEIVEVLNTIERDLKHRQYHSIFWGSMSVILFLMILTLSFFFRIKYKAQADECLKLREQNEDLESRLNGELNYQKDDQMKLLSQIQILQSQNEQMQKAALFDALQIERKNKLLDHLKIVLVEADGHENAGLFERMIKDELRFDEVTGQPIREFQTINPDFFLKLRLLSENKITALELKHCAYMYLQHSTLDIATAFHIEPKSVRVTKYRIKQKLKLDKEIDLEAYLQSLV
jgi:DNA-binding CsgD family transcriptional regulator